MVARFNLKKSTKIDYAEKAINFFQKQTSDIIDRFDQLETRVEALENISCEREDCPNRIKSV
jgi:hypothetical protein